MLKQLNVKRQGKDGECTRGGAKVSNIAEKACNEKAAWLWWRGEIIKGLLKNFPLKRITKDLKNFSSKVTNCGNDKLAVSAISA